MAGTAMVGHAREERACGVREAHQAKVQALKVSHDGSRLAVAAIWGAIGAGMCTASNHGRAPCVAREPALRAPSNITGIGGSTRPKKASRRPGALETRR